MFEIYIQKQAEKQLRKLPKSIVAKVFSSIANDIVKNPLPSNHKVKKLHAPLHGYRYKIPPYRILYTIENNVIRIYKIMHRQSGY